LRDGIDVIVSAHVYLSFLVITRLRDCHFVVVFIGIYVAYIVIAILIDGVFIPRVIGVLTIGFGKISGPVLVYVNRGTGAGMRSISSVTQATPHTSRVSRANLVDIDTGIGTLSVYLD
jgi:hypothetical protein